MHKAHITKCEKEVGSVNNSRITVSMQLISPWPNTTSVVLTVCVHTQTVSVHYQNDKEGIWKETSRGIRQRLNKPSYEVAKERTRVSFMGHGWVLCMLKK